MLVGKLSSKEAIKFCLFPGHRGLSLHTPSGDWHFRLDPVFAGRKADQDSTPFSPDSPQGWRETSTDMAEPSSFDSQTAEDGGGWWGWIFAEEPGLQHCAAWGYCVPLSKAAGACLSKQCLQLICNEDQDAPNSTHTLHCSSGRS